MENSKVMDKVSVIVPVYNYQNYIRKCLDSILNQTYSNLEVIVVDDGSTDRSGDICDEYAAKDARVVVRHKQNGGIGSAMKVAMELVTGEYVAFVDADDYIDARAYERLITIAKDTDADIVEFGTYTVNTDYEVYGDVILEDKIIEGNRAIVEDYFFVQTLPHLSSKFVKKELFDNFTVMDVTVAIDELTTVQLLENCEKIAFTHEVFYYAVRMKPSVSRAVNTGERLNESFMSHMKMISYLKEKNIWFADLYIIRFLKLLIGYRYNLDSGEYVSADCKKTVSQIKKNYRYCYKKIKWEQVKNYYSVKERVGLTMCYFFPKIFGELYYVIRRCKKENK